MSDEYECYGEYENNEYTNEYQEGTYNEYNDENFGMGTGLEKTYSFIILKEDQLLTERDEIIKQCMDFTGTDRNEAILILIFFQWSLDKINDKWYDASEDLRVSCGISQSKVSAQKLMELKIKPGNTECLICMSDRTPEEIENNLNCGHYFCTECWTEYLSVKSEDLLTCLAATCPQLGCNFIVPESYFFRFIKNPQLKEKFVKAILKNFTGYNSDIKVCPSPSCNISVRCESKIAKEITCSCGMIFCFKCWKEAHRPCSCEIIQKWELRSKSDTENDKWLEANTKTCPHCRQKIEKSQGCNYMLCNKSAGGCGKAFCYVCETDWEKHSQDHFKCNKYTPEIKEKENAAEKLKAEIARYKFYFDRYMNYLSAVKFAEKFRYTLEINMNNLIHIKLMPLSEINFLAEALDTVIYSKKTLKSTYVFGYYLKDGNEKQLFEYSQAFLERNADNLHQLIEQDSLTKILAEENFEAFNKKFTEFKNTIVNLCFATLKYQKNLLNEIETTMMHLIDDNLLNPK
jgi:ariadne-1